MNANLSPDWGAGLRAGSLASRVAFRHLRGSVDCAAHLQSRPRKQQAGAVRECTEEGSWWMAGSQGGEGRVAGGASLSLKMALSVVPRVFSPRQV